MQEEIKEAVYIGISALLLAIVLSFIIYGLELRNEYGKLRSDRANQIEYVSELNEYELYNGYDEYVSNLWNLSGCVHCINGNDLVSVIKKYGVENKLAIYVDNRGDGENLYIYGVENPLDYNTEYLQSIVGTNSEYHGILYFGNCDEYSMMNEGNYREYNRSKQVTGIVFIKAK